jgi:paraquat-inducible protein A
MKPMTRRAILILLFLALAWSGWKTWEQATAYERQTRLIISQLEAEVQLENSGRMLLELLSFGLYEGYTSRLEALNRQKQLQQAYQASVQLTTGIFFVLAGSILAYAWWSRRRLVDIGYSTMGIAFLALAVGLTTPILALQASRELPLLGETVFKFESKGVLSTITALQENGNLWLAVILFFFSVMVPVTKTLIVWLTLFSRTHHFTLRGLHLSHNLGKWSMADVFVVAILIAYFSSGGEDSLTQAEAQAGLWFFAAYVLLSLAGTQLIARCLDQPEIGQQPRDG